MMEEHPYKSSGLEASGVKCITSLSDRGGLPCGKPFKHPIHSVPPSAAVVALVDKLEVERVAGLTGIEARHELNRELGRAFDMLAKTPAEARTGISDRNAAALADVAELRRILNTPMANTSTSDVFDRLDRIERALRSGGSA